jgi:hypothetical protein
VKSLLENAQKTINPAPQRIIWSYGQWQQSYFDMLKTTSKVEKTLKFYRLCQQFPRVFVCV